MKILDLGGVYEIERDPRASDEVTIVFFEVYEDSIILNPHYCSRRK
jgi:hypothetical protein